MLFIELLGLKTIVGEDWTPDGLDKAPTPIRPYLALDELILTNFFMVGEGLRTNVSF